MNSKISNALSHLHQVLPLVERQQGLSNSAIRIHREILYAYAHTGMAPTMDELIAIDNRAENAVMKLQQLEVIVLDGNNNIIGAYPFTSEKRVHYVDLNGHRVHCMCALDALAISPMFKKDAVVHSQCVISAAPITIMQNDEKVLNRPDCDQIFLAIDWSAVSGTICCANSLCTQMNFISGSSLAQDWVLQSEHHELFSLDEAIEFTREFFVPLLSHTQAA